MHHDHEVPDTGPDNKEDRYPATVWSRYRTSGMPAVLLLGAVATLAGMLLDYSWLTKFGALAGGTAIALVIPMLVLGRADMRYDCDHPAEEVPS